MDVERRSKRRTDFVIDGRVICPIGDVECFSRELKAGFIAQPDMTAQAQIHTEIVGADAGIASCSRRPVGEIRPVTVDVGSGIKVEGMWTVILQDRRQFEPTQAPRFERTLDDACDDQPVPLVEG